MSRRNQAAALAAVARAPEVPEPPVTVNGCTLTGAEARSFRKAAEDAASDDKHRMLSGVARLREIEARTQRELDAARIRGAVEELAALERARGGKLVEEGRGADKVLRRRATSGLKRALDAGFLDDDRCGRVGGDYPAITLYRLGERYRHFYELVEGLKRPETDTDRPTRARQVASAGAPLAVLQAGEALDAMRVGLTPRMRAVLDQVCGLDRAVTVVSTALRISDETVKRDLKAGLIAVGANQLVW